MAAFVTVVALFVLAAVALALSNAPLRQYDLDDDQSAASDQSKVYYTKQTTPFVAHVERVRYGGRQHPADDVYRFNGAWRHEETLYRRWTGSKWVTAASTWRVTGSANDLAFHILDQDVDLTEGALVRQRLRFQYLDTVVNDWGGHAGRWNKHYLE